MSLNSLPSGAITEGNVVTRKVFINGTELSNEISLIQVTVGKSFNKIAWAKLVFIDGSASDQDFALSNDDMFKPGSEVKIQLGFDGDVETVFEGIIISHGVKIRSAGASQLLIEAKDKAIKLTATRNSKYFIDKTDKVIIEELATGLDTSLVEDITFSHKQIVQFEATNWDFILTRAEANSMLVFTDDGKLVVTKPVLEGEAILTATHGDNIFEFEAEMDARRQFQSVTGHSWDYTKQEAEDSSTGTSDFVENGDISSDDLGAVLGATVNLNHSGHLTHDQLQNWADAYAMRNKISKAVGRVRILGNAIVKPGNKITLDGVGDRFNGDVFVTGVLHVYDGFWQTDIQFGWQDEWFYKKENVMEKPAAGLLPGVNGLLIGKVVTVVDDVDGGQYRIKVHIPSITASTEGIWARVATLDAGAERGVYFRPQTDDEVVLGFLSDDPREAIVLGYLHSKDKHKSPFADTTDSQQEFGIITKEKIKLVFDDTNKKLTLSVPVGQQAKTFIIDSSGTMEMKDENSNSIKMDASGITIQAGSGNVTIKGTQVMIN